MTASAVAYWLPAIATAAFACGFVTNAFLLRRKWIRVRRQEGYVIELTTRLKAIEHAKDS